MTSPADQSIRCINCGEAFVWTETEQQYYAKRGLARPKRCQRCRDERKTQGTYGTQVVAVNTPSSCVLCKICRRPASRLASFRLNEAMCSGCACGDPLVKTEESDKLEYAEWERHYNTRRN